MKQIVFSMYGRVSCGLLFWESLNINDSIVVSFIYAPFCFIKKVLILVSFRRLKSLIVTPTKLAALETWKPSELHVSKMSLLILMLLKQGLDFLTWNLNLIHGALKNLNWNIQRRLWIFFSYFFIFKLLKDTTAVNFRSFTCPCIPNIIWYKIKPRLNFIKYWWLLVSTTSLNSLTSLGLW